MKTDNLLKTPLYSLHLEASARMIEFGGWLMPVQYEGIIKEHLETRVNVSLFDICHMGEFICGGSGAEEALSGILTADIKTLKTGRCRYGFILNDKAGIIDDCITYRLNKEKFMIVVNASRIETDYRWIKSHIGSNVSLTDVSADTGKIDIQGPMSREKAEGLFKKDFRGLSDFDIILSRTGYTGERGFEIYCSNDATVFIWKKLIEAGVKPAGLGARDTLRLEAGLPLYGHEFTEEITPACSAFGRFAKKEQNFIGKKVLASKEPEYFLTGFKLNTRQAARHSNKVFIDNKEAGWVTSGSFAPSLGYSIGLAYIKKNLDSGKFEIDTGKKRLDAGLCSFPFYKTKTV
jgi:aminomethyltransferase